MKLSFYAFISSSDTLEIHLKDQSHSIEKKRNIEYRISHRHDLPCHCHRYEITKSDRRSGDHSKVKSIKVAFSYRESLFKEMYEECPDDPAYKKNESNNDKFAMVNVKHI